jgi:prepilin-type N-terminal cleavage/methylation domain-containing protein
MKDVVLGRPIHFSKRGFTLVEILIAVGIMGLIAGMAVPSFFKARANAQRTCCIHNLRQLEAAKQNWAMEKGKRDGVKPKVKDITPYLQDQRMPVCPGGGNYLLQRLGRDPYCSLQANGHTLKVLYDDPDAE